MSSLACDGLATVSLPRDFQPGLVPDRPRGGTVEVFDERERGVGRGIRCRHRGIAILCAPLQGTRSLATLTFAGVGYRAQPRGTR